MASAGILFIDDDRAYLRLVESIFELAGISVSCVENGEDAIKNVSERCFPLVFTDYRMPGMDGLELARRCKEICPETRIVMITNEIARQKLSEEERRDGISKVYAKPHNLKGFLNILNSEKTAVADSLKDIIHSYARSLQSLVNPSDRKEYA